MRHGTLTLVEIKERLDQLKSSSFFNRWRTWEHTHHHTSWGLRDAELMSCGICFQVSHLRNFRLTWKDLILKQKPLGLRCRSLVLQFRAVSALSCQFSQEASKQSHERDVLGRHLTLQKVSESLCYILATSKVSLSLGFSTTFLLIAPAATNLHTPCSYFSYTFLSV